LISSTSNASGRKTWQEIADLLLTEKRRPRHALRTVSLLPAQIGKSIALGKFIRCFPTRPPKRSDPPTAIAASTVARFD